jgi:hypothetical protein
MSGSNTPVLKAEREPLRRRDWLLLPVLALLTVGALGVATELIARTVFPAYGDMKNCLVWNDRLTGVRGIPNCVCDEKIPEGKPVEYRFNSCGDYTSVACGQKPPGTFRIVMTGTSFPVGLGVPREDTFASLLPNELTQRTGHKVDLYNESLPRKSPHVIDMRFDAMLAAKPDMILWVLNYSDVELATLLAPSDYAPENVSPRIYVKQGSGRSDYRETFATLLWFRQEAVAWASVLAHAGYNSWRDTRSCVLLTHFMAVTESQRQFLERNRTSEGQYLDAMPSPARLQHLREFDGYAADIIRRAQAVHIPLVAVLLPTRVQAALISSGSWPANLDPFSLDTEVRSIIEKHGGTYIDILPDYRAVPNAERDFFPSDGHFNARGHAVVSDLLAEKLTSGTIPGLQVARDPSPASVRGQ